MSSRIARRSAASLGEMVTCLLMGWCPCLIRSGTAAQSLEDGARFEKRLDPERAEFAADAGMLESAPRSLLIIKHAVDRYTAGKDLRGDAARARPIGPAHEAVEA